MTKVERLKQVYDGGVLESEKSVQWLTILERYLRPCRYLPGGEHLTGCGQLVARKQAKLTSPARAGNSADLNAKAVCLLLFLMLNFLRE